MLCVSCESSLPNHEFRMNFDTEFAEHSQGGWLVVMDFDTELVEQSQDGWW